LIVHHQLALAAAIEAVVSVLGALSEYPDPTRHASEVISKDFADGSFPISRSSE
jgi:hypothetical protein